MKKQLHNPIHKDLDPDGLAQAVLAYKKSQEQKEPEIESMGRALIAYARAGIVREYRKYRDLGLSEDQILEKTYPSLTDRYIAVHERNRALGIISESFQELDWEGTIDVSEVALFLALVQNEIEGE